MKAGTAVKMGMGAFLMIGSFLPPVVFAAGRAPDFDGVWRVQTPVVQLNTIDGAAPPLLSAAQRIYDQRIAALRAGDRRFDTTTLCKPMGEPRTAYDPEGGPFEILVHPKVVVFAYTWNRMIRFVYVSKAPVDPIGPTYYGTANAQWQDGTLIVNVRDLHDTTLLDAAGMPHSEQLKLTERFRLTHGGSELEEVLHFDDPLTFSRPWQARVVYERQPGAHIAEDVCEERLGITDY